MTRLATAAALIAVLSLAAPVDADAQTQPERDAPNNLCNRQWLQQADGRDVQRHVQAAWADVDRVCNNLGSRPLHLALIFEGVNADCGGGNRPLHYALQDSLTPLTEGAYWGIAVGGVEGFAQ